MQALCIHNIDLRPSEMTRRIKHMGLCFGLSFAVRSLHDTDPYCDSNLGLYNLGFSDLQFGCYLFGWILRFYITLDLRFKGLYDLIK